MQDRKKVLLIVESGIVAADIKNMMQIGGFEVIPYSNVFKNAVKIFQRELPSLVIIDVSEGQLSDAFVFIKDIKRIQSCAVLYLIEVKDKNFINEHIKPTLDGFVVKPILGQNLVTAAKRLLYLHEQYRKLNF